MVWNEFILEKLENNPQNQPLIAPLFAIFELNRKQIGPARPVIKYLYKKQHR